MRNVGRPGMSELRGRSWFWSRLPRLLGDGLTRNGRTFARIAPLRPRSTAHPAGDAA
jgi:hypothetical protein